MKKKLLFSFVFVLAFVIQGFAQRTVSGTVTDDKAQAVIGATVFVKGNTKLGAVTDVDGKYSINDVPNGAILVVKAVDFKDKEINSGSQAVINFSLELDQIQQIEVISTGYGEIATRSYTGSAGIVESKKIENVPIQSFDQILQGRTPGALIQGSSGQPGSRATVLIRGRGSVNSSTDPLYIVDGIPVDPNFFGTLNPNDFETMNVLKDGPAVAIYGSRGANGVIVVTTKKGTKDKNIFTYNLQYGVSTPDYNRFLQTLNSKEKIQVENEIGLGYSFDRNGLGTPTEGELENLANTFTDWKKVLFKNGRTVQHEVTASGGSEKLRYYGSLNYYDQEGTVVNTNFKRYSGRLNLDYIDKNFSFSFKNTLSFTNRNFTDENNASIASPINAVYWTNPYEVVYDPTHISGYNVINTSPSNQPNPLEGQMLNRDKTDDIKGFSSIRLEYQLPWIDGLSVRTNWGVDLNARENEFLDHPYQINYLPVELGGTRSSLRDGAFQRSSRRRIGYTGTTSINYTKDINEDNSLRISLFQEIVGRQLRSFSFTGYGLTNVLLLNEAGITPGSFAPGDPANNYIPTVSGLRTNNAIFSVFLDGSYTFKKKYSLSANIRRDGSSKLLKDNRFVTTYSVGANWVMSDEEFLKNTKVSTLRLRASFATAANQDLITGRGTIADDFPAYALYQQSVYGTGLSFLQASVPVPDLKWERRLKSNFGLDYGFFDNRITGSVNLYNDVTKDVFFNRQLSRTSGFSELLLNIGEIRNRGVEFELNADVLRVGDFTWSLGGNITYNQNKVIKVLPGQDEIIEGLTITKEGYPLGSLYLVEYAGVNPANGDGLFYDKTGNIVPNFTGDPRKIFRPTQPPIFGGFNSEFIYKNFSLSVLFSYTAGHQLYNNEKTNIDNPGYLQDGFSREVLRRWQEPGDITDWPRFQTADGRLTAFQYTEEGFSTTRYMENAGYVRLRNLNIAYTLPAKWTDKAKLKGVKIFAIGQNLLTFTRWTGADPERGIGSATGALYPGLRTYTAGVNVIF
ncbi:MAG: SusC/RagA family TonB-linked outer membrane protein [Raineya sp.]|jgi:TonB-linked SusC/RagA family outer membrane protein|nr:SusC/RagA family TonB-linked outer membrane protein [Raineya sp.]